MSYFPLLILLLVYNSFESLPLQPSSITFHPSNDWGRGLCGSIHITNPSSTQTLHSFIISLKICHGNIQSSWGYGLSSKLINHENTFELWRFTGENLEIKPLVSYTDISLCISKDEIFEEINSLFLGADLYDTTTIPCNESSYCPLLSCGDGICSSNETYNSCPIDCLNSQCTSYFAINRVKGNSWTGVIFVNISSWYYNSLCGTIEIVNPSASAIAVSHVLTMKICTKFAQLNSFWGYREEMIWSNNQSSAYRQVGNGVNYLPLMKYSIGGFCMYVTNEFSLKEHIRVGIDLRDVRSNCKGKECSVICGDGVCDREDNRDLCDFDCNELNC